jgi:[CysO sulfur-carrier protein]-S-L-cysteine hydrolase
MFRLGKIDCRLERAMLSTSARLFLPCRIFESMVQHAQTELPNECCGLLAGPAMLRLRYLFPHGRKAFVRANQIHVAAWHPLVNELASPTKYQSDGASMFTAERAMRVASHDIVAVYHSHPTSEPIPSATDLAWEYYSDVIHFIIGLHGPDPVVRAWWLARTTFAEASWQIVEA